MHLRGYLGLVVQIKLNFQDMGMCDRSATKPLINYKNIGTYGNLLGIKISLMRRSN